VTKQETTALKLIINITNRNDTASAGWVSIIQLPGIQEQQNVKTQMAARV